MVSSSLLPRSREVRHRYDLGRHVPNLAGNCSAASPRPVMRSASPSPYSVTALTLEKNLSSAGCPGTRSASPCGSASARPGQDGAAGRDGVGRHGLQHAVEQAEPGSSVLSVLSLLIRDVVGVGAHPLGDEGDDGSAAPRPRCCPEDPVVELDLRLPSSFASRETFDSSGFDRSASERAMPAEPARMMRLREANLVDGLLVPRHRDDPRHRGQDALD